MLHCKWKGVVYVKIKKESNCKCLNCQADFFAYPSELKRGRGKFCCHKCSTDYIAKTHVSNSIEKKCEECGKDFLSKPSVPSRYCSMACKHIGHGKELRTIPDKACPICNTIFRPSHLKGQYCSAECWAIAEHKRVIIPCNNCGEPIEIKEFQLKKRNFCSDDCCSQWRSVYQTGNTYRLGHTLSKHTKQLMSEAALRMFENPEHWKNRSKHFKINKLESFFNLMTSKSVRFTGDGRIFVKFKDGSHKNPDFMIDGTNVIVELYGNYWHRDHDPNDLIQKYKEIGYNCLVFWEYDVYENIKTVLDAVAQYTPRKVFKRKLK